MSLISDIALRDPLHCIYFYYVQQDAAGLGVRVYYHFDEDTPIEDGQALMKLIEKLGANARLGDYAPPPCGHSISSVPWRRKSYLVVLLDDPVLKFPDKDALQITFRGDPHEAVNHSFFNAQKLYVDLPGDHAGQVVTALCCVNLMQHKDGRNMKDEDDPEEYSISVIPGGPLRRDDGGTNQGGPIPPPSFL